MQRGPLDGFWEVPHICCKYQSLYAVKQRKGTSDFKLIKNSGTPTQSTAGTNTWVKSCDLNKTCCPRNILVYLNICFELNNEDKLQIISTQFKLSYQLWIVNYIERQPFIVDIFIACIMDQIQFTSTSYLKISSTIYLRAAIF